MSSIPSNRAPNVVWSSKTDSFSLEIVRTALGFKLTVNGRRMASCSPESEEPLKRRAQEWMPLIESEKIVESPTQPNRATSVNAPVDGPKTA